jgi:hypothetical protein
MREKLHSILVPALLLVLVLTSCERRELWVYTDEFRQVELFTDWSQCDSRPDGMTAWFMSESLDGRNRRITTAEVEHTWLNLPRGRFTGVIFDWSPAEYANQEFSGMTRPDSALVRVRPASVQPEPDNDLYGSLAVPSDVHIPLVDSTGMHLLCVTPDPMCADTLKHIEIITGVEGDLIPWDTREEYEASLVTQTFYCQPKPITWDLRILIHVKGVQFMHSIQGTVAGLAEGMWLGSLEHTTSTCLHPLDKWQVQFLTDSTSVLMTTIHTFGLPNKIQTRAEDDFDLSSLRLNIRILLRDEETVLYYHFDVESKNVTIFEDQLVARVEIPIEVVLPYVDAKGSAGFDATVTPWEPGGSASVDI